MAKLNEWLVRPQRRLGALGLLILLVMASLVAPLSLDMYTPAVPGMASYFDTTPETVNFTLVGYYLFLAVGLLVFGPLSDKYGRRPVLIAGLAAYCASSIACALAPAIEVLVAARVVQALGSGAMSAVSMAVVKDAVRLEYRERMLAVMQVMFVIGPVAAPIIGAAILQFADWRATFWVLAVTAAVELVLALLYEETLDSAQRTHESVPRSLARLGHIGKNVAFMVFLFVTSAFEVAYMGYVSVGSYVYMDMFGFSAFGYSLFFAACAVTSAIGPLFWLKASKHTTVKRFTSISLVVSLALGLAVLAVGHSSAFVSCALFLLFAFFEATVRPYSVNVLLSQYDTDAGSASSLINFMRTFTGCAGMVLVMLPWSDYLVAVGMMMALGMVASLIGWALLLRSHLTLRGVKDTAREESLL